MKKIPVLLIAALSIMTSACASHSLNTVPSVQKSSTSVTNSVNLSSNKFGIIANLSTGRALSLKNNDRSVLSDDESFSIQASSLISKNNDGRIDTLVVKIVTPVNEQYSEIPIPTEYIGYFNSEEGVKALSDGDQLAAMNEELLNSINSDRTVTSVGGYRVLQRGDINWWCVASRGAWNFVGEVGKCMILTKSPAAFLGCAIYAAWVSGCSTAIDCVEK